MNNYAILSTYLIPKSLPKKRVNFGDGFILAAIERQLGPFAPTKIFTSREQPDKAALETLKLSRTVILGGANQLGDDFSIWPGLSASEFRRSGLRAVPFGIGINGDPNSNRAFSENTIATLEAIHEKVEFSSWRCPRTVAALETALPSLKGRFLMTGCPVVFDRPLLEAERFQDDAGSIAVTVTERGDFWDRESRTIEYIARTFPNSKRYLVLHQIFEPVTAWEKGIGQWPLFRAFLSQRRKLRSLARRLGFEIIVPASAKELIAFYENVGLHFGSRLHAHLLFLSRNKKSFLTYVDDRMLGFSDFLSFPLSDPASFDKDLDFDFERVRKAARATYGTMRKFVESIDRP